MKNFELLLRKHDLRITTPRRQVFEILAASSRPLSLPDIYDKCQNVDRASVYRTIDKLVVIGAVKVVYMGWKKLYELADLFSPHHHHLRCTACGDISHISDMGFEKLIEDMASQQGFKLTSHHFEIEGICPACQKINPSE